MGFFDFFSKDKKQNLDRGLQKPKKAFLASFVAHLQVDAQSMMISLTN